MLTKIREKIVGWVGLAFLVLIGVTFVFFGGSSFILSGGAFAAKVDGSEISIMRLQQEWQNELRLNPALVNATPEQRMFYRQQLLQSLIIERLLHLHLSDDGYQIADAEVSNQVRANPGFQVDGEFSREVYRTYLASQGLDATAFEEEQRRNLRIVQLQRAIATTSVVTPAQYRRFLNLIAEQRRVSTATFETAGVAEGIEVSDEQIEAFYNDNDTMFLTEETVDVEYIDISRDAVAANIEIEEAVLRQHYEDNVDLYKRDEQRQARHILILSGDDEDAARTEAEELLARIRGGESFAELAAEYSDDGGTASSGGDLGVLTRSQLPGELGGAIFSMQQGEVSGPIESDFGFHVVQLDAILEQGALPLDQVRDELLSELRGREADDQFQQRERELSDALFDASDMQGIAAATGLEVKIATGLTRFGGEPIGANQAAIDAIFDASILYDGEISEIIELDADRSAIFKVTAHHEASRQPLDEVRDAIVAAIQEQEAQAIVFGRAAQLIAALEAGEEFAAAAASAGADATDQRVIGRNDNSIDQRLREQVFRARKPSTGAATVGQVAHVDGGFTVFSLEAVVPGRPESIPLADRDAGKLELADQAGNSDFLAYLQALYNRADIVISEDVLAAQDLF